MARELAGSGLDERLMAAAREAGWERLTPLQAAALPVLRRGGNLVLHASTGAGVTGAFGLPLLERLAAGGGEPGAGEGAGGSGPRALILAPTMERAQAVASALGTLAGGSGVAVRATAPGWREAGATVLVATPDRVMTAVQDSSLKLEQLETLVLLDLAEQFALGMEAAVGTVVSLIPRDAQRVVTTAALDGDVERFIETHARRAMTVPPRPADPALAAPQEPAGQLGYLVLAEAEKPELLARLLEGAEGDARVHTRNARRAAAVLAELGRRGVLDTGAITVSPFDDPPAGGADRIVSYDVPFAADELRSLHETGGTVFVTPAELPHFRRIAGQVPFTLKQRRARTFDATGLDAFRTVIRTALRGEDLDAQLLVLEPLFAEHSHAEVAAALSALLRRRTPAPLHGAAPAPAAASGPPPREAGTGAFTRLFISVGSKDNIRPGDLVGAITGEAGIKGEQVGRVDIRETFSVVEVAAAAAERVIRALNGTTMRGRSVRVDYDRKTGGSEGAPRAGGRGGPRGAGGAGGPRAPGAGPRRRPPQR